MTKENEEKKRWLKRYRKAKRKVVVTELAILEVKQAQIMGNKGCDGMPHGKNNTDLSNSYPEQYNLYNTENNKHN